MKTSANSTIQPKRIIKKLTGFSFQNKRKSKIILYKYPLNFPKLFLKEIVEK
jgi:hypothetical protein